MDASVEITALRREVERLRRNNSDAWFAEQKAREEARQLRAAYAEQAERHRHLLAISEMLTAQEARAEAEEARREADAHAEYMGALAAWKREWRKRKPPFVVEPWPVGGRTEGNLTVMSAQEEAGA